MTLVRTIGLRINIWLLRANHPDKLRDVEVEGVQGPFVDPTVQGMSQEVPKIGTMDLKVDILKLEQEMKELKNGGLNKAFSFR